MLMKQSCHEHSRSFIFYMQPTSSSLQSKNIVTVYDLIKINQTKKLGAPCVIDISTCCCCLRCIAESSLAITKTGMRTPAMNTAHVWTTNTHCLVDDYEHNDNHFLVERQNCYEGLFEGLTVINESADSSSVVSKIDTMWRRIRRTVNCKNI